MQGEVVLLSMGNQIRPWALSLDAQCVYAHYVSDIGGPDCESGENLAPCEQYPREAGKAPNAVRVSKCLPCLRQGPRQHCLS